MATVVPNQASTAVRVFQVKRLAAKAATLAVLGLAFGFGYDWAAPRFYGTDRVSGFRLGVLHGALMPVALPSLLMGKDVPIYATNTTGRIYKLGYIAGINLCGFIFFGLAFARPKPKPRPNPAALHDGPTTDSADDTDAASHCVRSAKSVVRSPFQKSQPQ